MRAPLSLRVPSGAALLCAWRALQRLAAALKRLRKWRPFPSGSETYCDTAAGSLSGIHNALFGVAIFSALINILYLTGSLYMLQIYDRVLPSRSIPTLVALSVLAGTLFVAQAALDYYRNRILIRVGRSLEERLSPRIFSVIASPSAMQGPIAEPQQPLRDLDRIRGFLSSGGPLGFFDLPWTPFYLGICFLFHPLIGLAALLGALALSCLALCTEALTREPMRAAAKHGTARSGIADTTRRNAEMLTSMGMADSIGTIWSEANRKHLDAQERASDVAISLGNVAKITRMVLQSVVLGIGAYVVIDGEASGGIIIAGAILSARALAPIEQAITHWRGFVAARQSWRRLGHILAGFPEQAERLPLRRPCNTLMVQGAVIVPPGRRRPILQDVSFSIGRGSALGIIGPSGSGKSSLARVLVGVWRPAAGAVRLDGASLNQWSHVALGSHIGYLPQDNELLDGTIEQNIARFQVGGTPEAVLKAAEQAGVHDMIVTLPDGYSTRLGEGGLVLSGGQRQRIALARALYNDPFLVVLDEPNSNLDAEGEQALFQAVAAVKGRGGIVIMIAHRTNALAAVDQVLVLASGIVQAFGPRDEILRKMLRQVSPPIAQPAAGAPA